MLFDSMCTICNFLVLQILLYSELSRIQIYASVLLSVFKKMAGFTGWTFLGNLASVTYTQGLNILLNLFFAL